MTPHVFFKAMHSTDYLLRRGNKKRGSKQIDCVPRFRMLAMKAGIEVSGGMTLERKVGVFA